MITLHDLFVLGVCFSIVGGFCGFTPIIWPIEKRRNLFSLQIQKLSNEKKEDTNRWKVLKPWSILSGNGQITHSSQRLFSLSYWERF